MTKIISFSFVKSSTELSALLISLMIKKKILIFLFLIKVWYIIISIITILISFFVSVDWKRRSWSKLTWVLDFAMKVSSMNQVNSMNLFTDFWFMSLFKMIIDVIIEFKFFHFILQICKMLIDCLLLKQQISMFESSTMILINCL